MMRFGMTQWKIGGGSLSRFAGEPRSCPIISVQTLKVRGEAVRATEEAIRQLELRLKYDKG